MIKLKDLLFQLLENVPQKGKSSGDPMMRDDAGNVIPLSQRFDDQPDSWMQQAAIIEKHGSRIGGIVNDLASVLRNGDPLTTEGDAYGFEIVTDEVKDGELYISYIENKSSPKRTVANVLIGLSDLFDLRLTPLGGSQEKYYESLGFVKKGKDMVLKKATLEVR